MGKKYDVVAVTGSYQKEGQEKLKYKNIGVVIETEKGLRLKLETPVVLDDEGKVVQWFGLYEPKDNQSSQQAQQQSATANNMDNFDDDLTF